MSKHSCTYSQLLEMQARLMAEGMNKENPPYKIKCCDCGKVLGVTTMISETLGTYCEECWNLKKLKE